MRTVLSITVAFIIALHCVLGCCWHHAHDLKACAAAETKAATGPKRAGCRHHKHQASPLVSTLSASAFQERDSEHHDHRCCDEKCDLVSMSRVELDDASSISIVESSATVEDLVSIPASPHLQLQRIADDAAPPPIRRHLLLRLLLI